MNKKTILFKIETDKTGIGYEHQLDKNDAKLLPHVIAILETAKLEMIEMYKDAVDEQS